MAPRLCLGTLAIALMVAAAPRSEDPDWPCQQRLVPKLAPAAYWNGPLDGQGDWRLDPEVAELVRELAPRRVTTEQGLAQIAVFAQTAWKIAQAVWPWPSVGYWKRPIASAPT